MSKVANMEEKIRKQKMPFDSETVELELNCKDGSTVWAETSLTFLDEAYGRRREILGSYGTSPPEHLRLMRVSVLPPDALII